MKPARISPVCSDAAERRHCAQKTTTTITITTENSKTLTFANTYSVLIEQFRFFFFKTSFHELMWKRAEA